VLSSADVRTLARTSSARLAMARAADLRLAAWAAATAAGDRSVLSAEAPSSSPPLRVKPLQGGQRRKNGWHLKVCHRREAHEKRRADILTSLLNQQPQLMPLSQLSDRFPWIASRTCAIKTVEKMSEDGENERAGAVRRGVMEVRREGRDHEREWTARVPAHDNEQSLCPDWQDPFKRVAKHI
jgi:hypothetical protein